MLIGTNYDSETSHSLVVVILNRIDPPLYRCFFYNGSIVIFSSSSICDVNVTSVMYNVTLQRKKITDGLPCLREVGNRSIHNFYPTGEPVFKKDLQLKGTSVIA